MIKVQANIREISRVKTSTNMAFQCFLIQGRQTGYTIHYHKTNISQYLQNKLSSSFYSEIRIYHDHN